MIAWTVFIILVVISSIAANRLIKSSVIACLSASAFSTSIFQLIVAIQLGHWDKFTLIAVFITFPISLVVAALVIVTLRRN